MNTKANIFDLSVKRALITGSSQGIGYMLAKGLSEAGACVFLSSGASSFVNGQTLFVDGGITACI